MEATSSINVQYTRSENDHIQNDYNPSLYNQLIESEKANNISHKQWIEKQSQNIDNNNIYSHSNQQNKPQPKNKDNPMDIIINLQNIFTEYDFDETEELEIYLEELLSKRKELREKHELIKNSKQKIQNGLKIIAKNYYPIQDYSKDEEDLYNGVKLSKPPKSRFYKVNNEELDKLCSISNDLFVEFRNFASYEDKYKQSRQHSFDMALKCNLPHPKYTETIIDILAENKLNLPNIIGNILSSYSHSGYKWYKCHIHRNYGQGCFSMCFLNQGIIFNEPFKFEVKNDNVNIKEQYSLKTTKKQLPYQRQTMQFRNWDKLFHPARNCTDSTKCENYVVKLNELRNDLGLNELNNLCDYHLGYILMTAIAALTDDEACFYFDDGAICTIRDFLALHTGDGYPKQEVFDQALERVRIQNGFYNKQTSKKPLNRKELNSTNKTNLKIKQ